VKIIDKIKEKLGMTDERMRRRINVRFPDMCGDTNRSMTIQELKDSYGHCMLIDPKVGEKVEILDLTDLDKSIEEVVAMPPIRGG
jgi:hypothetical protein